MTNLPSWPGAAVVYDRAQRIATALNTEAYKAQRSKTKAKKFRFSPCQEAALIIEVMNSGDEELLKSKTFQYRAYWK